jgi:hypothetical protein
VSPLQTTGGSTQFPRYGKKETPSVANRGHPSELAFLFRRIPANERRKR